MHHTFATHLPEAGVDIRYIQELLGHKDIKTTIRYTKIAHSAVKKIKNPFDSIPKKLDKEDAQLVKKPP